uniref:Uncharacterized protein n=1 Tax=Xanthomonas phage MK21 TaxID=3148942 RepID=A0AAU7J8Y8_9CAUD
MVPFPLRHYRVGSGMAVQSHTGAITGVLVAMGRILCWCG